jgi:hypothetical protein
MFSDHFDMLISKLILKKIKKKHYFNVFWNKKQPLPHSQIHSKHKLMDITTSNFYMQ